MAEVLAFAPRPQPAPVLAFCEISLNAEDCSLTLTAYDDAGHVVTFEYALASKPDDFDLSLLVEAWARWRGGSTKAS
jgi:hypothetical protein